MVRSSISHISGWSLAVVAAGGSSTYIPVFQIGGFGISSLHGLFIVGVAPLTSMPLQNDKMSNLKHKNNF